MELDSTSKAINRSTIHSIIDATDVLYYEALPYHDYHSTDDSSRVHLATDLETYSSIKDMTKEFAWL